MYALERKYQDLYQPLHDKRKTIVTGEFEPTGKETEWTYEANDEDVTPEVQSITNELRKNLQINYQDDVKGVPDFWLTIFRNTEMLSSMLQPPDEPALKKLIDIKIIYEQEPMSYTLEFHFEPNEYFTNTVLTKQYFLKSKVDAEYPFTFEGPEIFKCVGCNIDWHKGKNLTVKTIKRKQKHKARGAVRTVTKQVPADSFFNFFKPPQIQDESKIDLEDQAVSVILPFSIFYVIYCHLQYRVFTHSFCSCWALISKSVISCEHALFPKQLCTTLVTSLKMTTMMIMTKVIRYFHCPWQMGKLILWFYWYISEEEEEEEEGDEDEDEESESDQETRPPGKQQQRPHGAANKKKGGPGGPGGPGGAAGQSPAECKQQ